MIQRASRNAVEIDGGIGILPVMLAQHAWPLPTMPAQDVDNLEAHPTLIQRHCN
jgi:hypothetical protein